MWSLKIYRQGIAPTEKEIGFTLLEVMVALSFIAIALTVLLVSQSQSLSLAHDAKFNTTAPLLARSKMAEIEAMKSADLLSNAGDFGDAFPDYYWESQVHQVSFPGIEQYTNLLKQIDVTIFWGEDRRFQYNLRFYRFAY